MPHEKLSVPILGVSISRLGLRETAKFCLDRIESGKGGYVCFVNVHSLVEANKNPAHRSALDEADLAAPDGVPLLWVSSLTHLPIRERVCGPDFMSYLIREYPSLKHGFIGGDPSHGKIIGEFFGVDAPFYSPPFRPFSESAALEDWNAFVKNNGNRSLPSVIWVGLGAPKQELWMHAVAPHAPGVLFFGVGAAFDFLAGKKKRAPVWMQKVGLEWLFRLFQEPTRLWKRYFLTNFLFVVYLIRQLIGRSKP